MTEKLPVVIESSLILEAFCSVRKERLLYSDQHEEDYFTVTTAPESVAIIALSPSGDILVTQEYRHPVKSVVFGCPGGLIEPGELVIEAARRELREETGCVAKEIQNIGECFPLPGLLAQKMHVVVATDVECIEIAQAEATEIIASRFMKKDELFQIVQSAQNIDGVFCSALFFWLISSQHHCPV